MAEAAILLAYEEGEEPGLAFLFSFIHKRSSKCPIRLMKLSASVVALACLLVRSKPSLRMATSARSTNPLVSIAALASPLAPPVLSRHKGYLPSKSKTCPLFRWVLLLYFVVCLDKPRFFYPHLPLSSNGMRAVRSFSTPRL